MNAMQLWSEEVDFPVTICDKNGIIAAMNQKSKELFKKDGGGKLIGKSLLDCHPEPSRTKLLMMLENHQPNTYISNSDGKNRLVHETPWHVQGEYMGFVEVIISIP